MANLLSFLCIVVALALASPALAANGRGFGDHINWLNDLDEAQKVAKAEGKPMMIVIHKTWCGACKRLKPEVAKSDEVADLAAHFVMVNLEDSEEPSEEQYKPDGGYIPRVLFADDNGDVDPSLINADGNPKYKFFYATGQQVEAGMRRAAVRYGVDAGKF